jgi:SAM-dependent methyltransferase
MDPWSVPANAARFTGRVEAYRRYRSRYPREIIPLLIARCGLAPSSVVADIGAGTGMLAELFLAHGNQVLAIEPHPEMRAALEELAAQYARLSSLPGTAEQTGLPDQSVDFIAAGRAFHWFDHSRCRPEFLRILRPNGWMLIAGLGPRRGSEPVEQDYERLLEAHSVDYAAHRSRYAIGERAREFFGSEEVEKAEFPGLEDLSYQALEGRMLSLSVTPQPGDARFLAFQRDLQAYFEQYQLSGRIQLPTNCKLYFGHLR